MCARVCACTHDGVRVQEQHQEIITDKDIIEVAKDAREAVQALTTLKDIAQEGLNEHKVRMRISLFFPCSFLRLFLCSLLFLLLVA